MMNLELTKLYPERDEEETDSEGTFCPSFATLYRKLQY